MYKTTVLIVLVATLFCCQQVSAQDTVMVSNFSDQARSDLNNDLVVNSPDLLLLLGKIGQVVPTDDSFIMVVTQTNESACGDSGVCNLILDDQTSEYTLSMPISHEDMRYFCLIQVSEETNLQKISWNSENNPPLPDGVELFNSQTGEVPEGGTLFIEMVSTSHPTLEEDVIDGQTVFVLQPGVKYEFEIHFANINPLTMSGVDWFNVGFLTFTTCSTQVEWVEKIAGWENSYTW